MKRTKGFPAAILLMSLVTGCVSSNILAISDWTKGRLFSADFQGKTWAEADVELLARAIAGHFIFTNKEG